MRAVFPHTALRSVGSREGLNVSSVGVSQTLESTLDEPGVGPAVRTAETLRIVPMTFQKLPTQTLADHSIVLVEQSPRTVTKVVEPADGHSIEFLNRGFH